MDAVPGLHISDFGSGEPPGRVKSLKLGKDEGKSGFQNCCVPARLLNGDIHEMRGRHTGDIIDEFQVCFQVPAAMLISISVSPENAGRKKSACQCNLSMQSVPAIAMEIESPGSPINCIVENDYGIVQRGQGIEIMFTVHSFRFFQP